MYYNIVKPEITKAFFKLRHCGAFLPCQATKLSNHPSAHRKLFQPNICMKEFKQG